MKTQKILRFIYVLSGISFLLLLLPFHKLLSVFTLTEVRPAAVLYPLLGISFGWPAALGIMTANGICDAINGYSAAVLIEGLVPQLIYTMVPYYLWRYLIRDEEHIHCLNSVERVWKYVLVCAAVSFYKTGRTFKTYDIWNTIYLIELVFINITMLISVLCMNLNNKRNGS